MVSLEQKRSKHASDQVAGWLGLGGKERKELSSACKDLPVLLRVNGLLAVLLAKQGSRQVIALTAWLTSGDSYLHLTAADLHSKLDKDRDLYRRTSAEAMAYAAWLKRWVVASLEVKGKSSDEAGKESEKASV